jgi:hypothetical protein
MKYKDAFKPKIIINIKILPPHRSTPIVLTGLKDGYTADGTIRPLPKGLE